MKRETYSLASLIKLLWGLVILLVDYFVIDVNQDLFVAISLGLIGFFVFLRGLSYFLFYRVQKMFCGHLSLERIKKDSYKTSFLFGLYALINVLLFLDEKWNKIIGIILLLVFIFMQYMIFTDAKRKKYD